MATGQLKFGRLSREKWLERALKIVAAKGGARLRVETLVAAMGVTKGSFYWHFRNRDDFVHQLIQFWDDHYTRNVIDMLAGHNVDARQRLFALMKMVYEQNLNALDIPFRSWAAQEPKVAAMVAKVDRVRLDAVRSLFKEMRFKGKELEVRTRAFVTFVSLEPAIFDRLSKKERLAQLKARHAFFTRP